MIVWGWLFTAAVGVLFLRQALYTGDDNIAILTSLMSTASWGLFAYQSLTVEFTVGGGADPVTRRYPAMSFFGLAFAVIALYIALTGPIAAIGASASDLGSTDQQPPQQ